MRVVCGISCSVTPSLESPFQMIVLALWWVRWMPFNIPHGSQSVRVCWVRFFSVAVSNGALVLFSLICRCLCSCCGVTTIGFPSTYHIAVARRYLCMFLFHCAIPRLVLTSSSRVLLPGLARVAWEAAYGRDVSDCEMPAHFLLLNHVFLEYHASKPPCPLL